MPRGQEFTAATRIAAYERAGGKCECGCDRPVDDPSDPKSRPEYHHQIEVMMGGTNDLDNCMCIRLDCHRSITKKRQPNLAKVRRADKKRKGTLGLKKRMSYRKFDGTPVWK